jgi:hypothetical protein
MWAATVPTPEGGIVDTGIGLVQTEMQEGVCLAPYASWCWRGWLLLSSPKVDTLLSESILSMTRPFWVQHCVALGSSAHDRPERVRGRLCDLFSEASETLWVRKSDVLQMHTVRADEAALSEILRPRGHQTPRAKIDVHVRQGRRSKCPLLLWKQQYT